MAQSHRRRVGGRVLFYSFVVLAVCWLQVMVNVFVYVWKHHDPSTKYVGRFPVHVARLSPPESDSTKSHSNITSGGNLRSGRGNATTKQISPSLETQLLELQKRLEVVTKNIEDEIRTNEEASLGSSVGGKGSSTKQQQQQPRKIFVPFTIRDAQRTVPTQIPHGFEVFDFIDLYATNSDQNQTAALEAATKRNKTTSLKKNGGSDNDSDDIFYNEYYTPSSTARLFHNGKPLSEDVNDDDSKCLGYSKKCYRSKFLKVIRYLLSLQKAHQGDNKGKDIEYYYFYMEADNDLCVPLNEIRDLAFQHERYFISAGIGASGWIMSRAFLEDFYGFWKTLQAGQEGLSEERILEPDSVAEVLLKKKQAWSVTRRYLTSHSILTGETEDEASIAALFDQPVVANTTNTTTGNEGPTNQTVAAIIKDSSKEKEKEKKKKKKETPEEAALNAPPLEPLRYLPRCLEPHRGVWRNDTTNGSSTGFDVHHWDFFDYDLCPESEIFPCSEGQLEELAKNDPYY